jgi:hypothetical protein
MVRSRLIRAIGVLRGRADRRMVHKPASPPMLVATLQGVLAEHGRGIN